MRRVVLAAVAVLVLAACSGKHHAVLQQVPTVVAGAASSWKQITINAGPRSVELPSDLRARVAPLLASRNLPKAEPFTVYGLDHPLAQLSYRGPGRAADVIIGSANFDRHFFYAARAGQPTVYLVPADSLRPVVALVGIDVAPPD